MTNKYKVQDAPISTVPCVKEPIPCRWVCGECGAEMRLLPDDLLVCTANWCAARGEVVPVPKPKDSI